MRRDKKIKKRVEKKSQQSLKNSFIENQNHSNDFYSLLKLEGSETQESEHQLNDSVIEPVTITESSF